MAHRRPNTTLWQKLGLIIFGLVLGLVGLEIILRLGGLAYEYFQEKSNAASLAEGNECVILCLGESTTGLGGDNSYPRQLEEVLREQGAGSVAVINKGIPGGDSGLIVRELPKNIDRYRPDYVVVMMGINDNQTTGIAEVPPAGGLVRFVRGCRVYKLLRLLQQHIQASLAGTNVAVGDKVLGARGLARESSDEFRLRERELKAVLAANPEGPEGYARLGDFYHLDYEMDSSALRNYRRAVELDPERYETWVNMIDSCSIEDEPDLPVREMARKAFSRAVSLQPDNPRAYVSYGKVLRWQRKFREAADLFSQAARLTTNPDRLFWINLWLGQCRLYIGEYEKAEKALKEAIRLRPGYDRGYLSLLRCYQDMGREEEAREMKLLALEHRPRRDWDVTAANYRRLAEILRAEDIKLICVQYPMRSVFFLREMLGDGGDLIFVDNERVFKEAVAREGYDALFTDFFAGDFGHCTPRGNRLLAEQVARVLLDNRD